MLPRGRCGEAQRREVRRFRVPVRRRPEVERLRAPPVRREVFLTTVFRRVFFLPVFFRLFFVRPSALRFLFTVAAAIALARLLERPLLLSLSLMCSY